MATDLILVSVLKDTGFVMMGKHVNVSYSATQIFITHIEEMCEIGFYCPDVAVHLNAVILNARGFRKFLLFCHICQQCVNILDVLRHLNCCWMHAFRHLYHTLNVCAF